MQQTKQRQQKVQLGCIVWFSRLKGDGGGDCWSLPTATPTPTPSPYPLSFWCPSHSPVSASLLALPLPLPAELIQAELLGEFCKLLAGHVVIVCGIIACDYAARSAVQFISWEPWPRRSCIWIWSSAWSWSWSTGLDPQQPLCQTYSPIFTLVGSWRRTGTATGGEERPRR